MKKFAARSLILALLSGLTIAGGASAIDDNGSRTIVDTVEKRIPVKIDGKKLLPLRVLARPFSNIYKDKSIESGIVQSDVPALQPFYVYTRPSAEDMELESGWYEVGTNNHGNVIGWMQAKDVFEWKQTMCLAYTHPAGRKPVLMFDSKSTLNKLIQEEDEKRIKEVSKIYTAINEHNISKDFPVKSIEPKKAVDIQKEFYLLPILDFKEVDFGNREARLLKLTAVTNAKAGARDESDIRKSKIYLEEAIASSTIISKEKLKTLNVDIVWVMDTTVSMRPYIQNTLEVIKSASETMASNLADNVKLNFGIWGYRDNVEDIPKIGYNTKNYTPELVGIKDFVNVLAGVKVTQVDSVDYPEDMFSGVADAMEKTGWTPDSMKFIILVGDAPSHKVGHKWNLSGQNEETLRSLADDSNVYIAAFHLQNPKAKKFKALAETQYRTLAANPGNKEGDSAFQAVATTNKDAFKEKVNYLTTQFKLIVNNAREAAQNEPSTSSKEGELAFTVDVNEIIPQDDNSSGSDTKNMVNRMFRAAMVKWIGSQTEAKAPRDIVAWAIDKDLEDPEVPSMEVRVLINKRQLDSLATVLKAILKAGFSGQITGEDFFTSLQAAAATIARDPNMIKQAKTMAETGLVPEFLVGLPYKSKLMSMNNEYWNSLSADEQSNDINMLDAKLEAYKQIHDSPEGWIALNKGDDKDEYVYPLSLDLLP
jgi:hypothetical protein